MNLTQLNAALYTPTIRTDLTERTSAALLKTAGSIIRDGGASPARKAWALTVLRDPKTQAEAAIGILLTNPTVQATLDAGTAIPDGDIEFIVAAEVLPAIAPA